MYGAQIAFKDFNVGKGIWGSPWVGFKHFRHFFNSYQFWKVIWNTISLSLYQLIAGFPFPIILALSLNYVKNIVFKKTVQMITYAPYFISVVVLVGIINQLLAPRTGLVNNIISAIAGKDVDLLGNPALFKSIYVWSRVWKDTGFASIMYLAVLASVDVQQHEAAIVDGATKLQRIWHVDIPGILPTAVILFIMNVGQVLNVGIEQTLLMQNPLNLRSSEIISTYVYKVGLTSSLPNYSYATAIGLFQSLVGLVFIIIVNRISRKVSETSLW